MNRIDALFARKSRDVLAVYFTAGFPVSTSVCTTILELEAAGADLVEVGMPFSDPLADGPVIQESSAAALRGGMTINKLFGELEKLRAVSDVPVVLMGYLNPVLQFGFENFISKCAACGIDGVILPDLPVEEFEEQYRGLFEKYGVFPIFLVCPSTPIQRVRKIATHSRGFLYLVSSSATTGIGGTISPGQQLKLKVIADQCSGIPVMVGFGIHDRNSFDAATHCAQGGIVGSAFIRELSETKDVTLAAQNIIGRLKNKQHDRSVL